MQDAWNLGWKLAAVLKGANEQLLDTYQQERLPVAAAALGFSDDLMSGGAAGVVGTGQAPDTLQLALSYRGGPLAAGVGTSAPGVQPGDRAPDAPLIDAHGRRVRLFDALRGPRFTTIRLGGADARVEVCRLEHAGGALSLSAPAVFREVDGTLAGAYAMSGSLEVTVRPDGYVLARSDHPGPDSPLHAVQQVIGAASG